MEKIEVTLGDLREAWYAMECPTNFNDFVQDYEEDPEYDVINTWICSESFDDMTDPGDFGCDPDWDNVENWDINDKLSIEHL